MSRAVLVPCKFRRAGFSSQLVYTVRANGGEYDGLTSNTYAFLRDGVTRCPEPPEGEVVDGLIKGNIFGQSTGDTVPVHLPDGQGAYRVAANDLVEFWEVGR